MPGRMYLMATPLAGYDPTTLVGQVRLLISDVTDPPFFSDAEIQAFLALRKDNPTRAAASALMAIANNEALLLKYVRTDDLTIDGVKGATELRLQARQLEAQANDDDAEFFMLDYPADDSGLWPPYSRGLEYEYHYHGGW